MPLLYFKNRTQAGQQLLEIMPSLPKDIAVVSLSTEATLVANVLAQTAQCPLQLYIEESIVIPGGLSVGSVNQDGQFEENSDLDSYTQEYLYQEFRGYIEENKRETFSNLNRELKGQETIRHDLLQEKEIFLVADCLESLSSVNSFIQSIKSVNYRSVSICAPVAMSTDVSRIRQVVNAYSIIGFVDFYFGADHYFEDNTVVDKNTVIKTISNTLKLWP